MRPDVEIAPRLLKVAGERERAALRRAAAMLRSDSAPDDVVMDWPFYLYRKRVGDLNVVYGLVMVEGTQIIQIVGLQSA